MPANPATLELEQRHLRRLGGITTRIAQTVAQRFGTLATDQLATELRRATRQAAEIIAGGQREAQILEAAYYATALQLETGRAIPTPAPTRGIAGSTVDGRPLTAALGSVAPAVFMAIAGGRPAADALRYGAFGAGRIAQTEVGDAAWRELLTQMQADDLARGWTWAIDTSGGCGACLASADGTTRGPAIRMARHPNCQCIAVPVFDVPDRVARPTGAELFERMDPEQQAATFRAAGEAKAAAIRDGRVTLDQLATLNHHAEWRATVTEASLFDLGIEA